MSARPATRQPGTRRLSARNKPETPSSSSSRTTSDALDSRIAERMLAWFDQHGRSDLPWQHPRTPYRVWLSEIMLQQTQVTVVCGYFDRFVTALPDLPALAAAPLDQVLALWSGLGYYARARNLHAAAKLCVERHDGELPRELDALMALPGIGRSTAGAILSQAWDDPAPILDGNVKRVLCRLFGIEGWPGAPAIEKQLWSIAERLLPRNRLADWTQAQMDFGATSCTRANPDCADCPLQDECTAYRQGRTSELPSPKPGKPLPQRATHMLIITDDAGRVLLQRRPPSGVWASLWSLPEHAELDEARRWFRHHVDGEFESARAMDELNHGFSHFRLRIRPSHIAAHGPRACVSDAPDMHWASRSELASLGLPAPVRKLLQRPDVFEDAEA